MNSANCTIHAKICMIRRFYIYLSNIQLILNYIARPYIYRASKYVDPRFLISLKSSIDFFNEASKIVKCFVLQVYSTTICATTPTFGFELADRNFPNSWASKTMDEGFWAIKSSSILRLQNWEKYGRVSHNLNILLFNWVIPFMLHDRAFCIFRSPKSVDGQISHSSK